MALTKTYIVWQDAYGETAVTSYYALSVPTGVLAALNLLSNAVPGRSAQNTVNQLEPSFSVGAYRDVDTILIVEAADEFGELVSVRIPAPKIGLFEADGVRPDQAICASLWAVELRARILTRSGRQTVRFVRAYVRQREVRS